MVPAVFHRWNIKGAKDVIKADSRLAENDVMELIYPSASHAKGKLGNASQW